MSRCSLIKVVIAREGAIQYAAAFLQNIGAAEYWIARSSRAMTLVEAFAFNQPNTRCIEQMRAKAAAR